MMQRQTMKAAELVTRDMPNTADEESMRRKPIAYRGPKWFVNPPSMRRAKIVPVIAAMLAPLVADRVMLRSCRMVPIRGAAAKVEKKVVKKHSQLRWKLRW
jgi:hypothetical protein